jgi:HEAT repeat protein
MRRLLLVFLAALVAGCGGKTTDEWVGQLRSGDGAQRLHAVKALGDKGAEAPTVIPALTDALKDQNAFVRRDAALALGRLGAEAKPAVPALLAARRERERSVRKAADEALKKIDPQAAARAGVR